MSRPWKNELRLELRTNGCYAELRRMGWSRKLVASASASGRGAAAISAAIAALRMADTDLLTADARLIVADEYVDFALLGAEVSGGSARQKASDHFSSALGHDDLLVSVTPLPGARGWLAAAIDLTDYTAWTEVLGEAGVQLRHVHPAFIEDLRTLSDRIQEDNAVVVLLREEGATLMRLTDGVPGSVVWERFDPTNPVTLENRLRSFARQTTTQPDAETVIYMLPQSKALCRFVWEGRDNSRITLHPRPAMAKASLREPAAGVLGRRPTAAPARAVAAEPAGLAADLARLRAQARDTQARARHIPATTRTSAQGAHA